MPKHAARAPGGNQRDEASDPASARGSDADGGRSPSLTTRTPTGQADSVLEPPSVDELRRRTSRGFLWTMLQSVGSRILSTLVFITLARLLAPSEFGLVAFAAVFVSLLQLLVYAGYNQALVQLKTVDKKDYDTVFWTGVTVGALLTTLLAGLAPVIARLVDEPQLTPVLRVMSIAILIAALGSGHQAVLQRELRFGSLAVRRMLASLASSVVGLGMALYGAGVWALVGQTIALAVGSVIALWVASGYRPGLGFSFRRLRNILRTSLYMLSTSLLFFAIQRSDDFLIGAILGTRALGFYSVAYRLLLLLLDVLATSIQTVAFPTFARLQEQSDRLRSGFIRMTRLAATVAVPIFLLVGVMAPEVVELAFGPSWAQSVPVMQVLAVFGALQVILQLNTSMLNSIGRASTAFGIQLLNAITTIIAFVVAVNFGIVWVAAALTLRAYLFAPVSLVAVCRHTGLRLRTLMAALVPPFFFAALTAALCLVVQSAVADLPAIVRLVCIAVAGLTAYLLLLLLFARSYLSDVAVVAKGIRPGRRPGSRTAELAGRSDGSGALLTGSTQVSDKAGTSAPMHKDA